MLPKPDSRRLAQLAVFYLVFLILWTIWVLVLKFNSWTSVSWMDAGRSFIIRLLLWILPVAVFIWLQKWNWRESLGITGFGRKELYWTLVGIAVTCFLFAFRMILEGRAGWSLDLVKNPYTWLSAIVFTPIVEETVFRGLIFKLTASLNPWLAGLINVVLFVGIHLPGWFILSSVDPLNVIGVGVTGALLFYVRLKSDSLWPGMLVHAFNNFLF